MKLKSKFSKIIATTGLILTVLGAMPTSEVFAHKNFFIKSVVDYAGFGIISEVITDNGKGDKEGTTEEEKGNYSYSNFRDYRKIVTGSYSESSFNHLTLNFMANRGTPKDREGQYESLKNASDENSESSDYGLVFSFPGLGDAKSGGYVATSADASQATLVSETLTRGLNDALLFIQTNAKEGFKANKQGLNSLLARLSNVNSDSSFVIPTLGGTRFEVKPATESMATNSEGRLELIPVSGLRYSDYVRIKVLNGPNEGNYSFFPWRIGKGYYSGQALSDNVPTVYKDNAEGKSLENKYLTWGQMILQAMKNADVEQKDATDYAVDTQTLIGQGLGADLSGTIASVRSILNLAPMQELILNMGARTNTHYLGVMKSEMYNTAQTVFVINLMVALLFLGFLSVKLIHQKMLATTNVIARTSLMEGLKDIIFVAMMLGCFAPIFELMMELNFLIVRTFSFSSEYLSAYGISGVKLLSMQSMAGFIVSTMFLTIDVCVNFVYLVRAITVSFLYAIAPIVIVSYCWGPMQKILFMSYMRELVGNIFVQSFHAITMTFFSGYNQNNMSSLEAITSAYCFLPITQLFRQLVVGNQGGFSEKIGGQLAGQITNMTTGMQKSGMMARQSMEMTTAQAKANMLSSEGAYKANAIQQIANMTNMGLQSSSLLGEIGGGKVGSGGGWKGTAVRGGMALAKGALGAGLTYASTKGAMAVSKEGAEAGQKTLGEMNHKHAMENIQFGAMEMGIGLGTSSYDAGTGSAMMAGGLRTFQEGARQYGEGSSRKDMTSGAGYYMGQNAQNREMWQGIGTGVGTIGMSAGAVVSGAGTYFGNRIASTNASKVPSLSNLGITDKSLKNSSYVDNKNVYANTNFTTDVVKGFGKENSGATDQQKELNRVYNAWKDKDNSKADQVRWKEVQAKHNLNDIKVNGATKEISLVLDKSCGIEGFSLGVDKTKVLYNQEKYLKSVIEDSSNPNENK